MRQAAEWLKYGAVTLAVFLVCWTIVLWFWHKSHEEPGTGELVLSLLVLPLVLLLGIWKTSKMIAASDAATIAAGAKRAATPPIVKAAVENRAPVLAVVAASMRSPHGNSAEELAGAIADNEARADLDRELVDDNGFPVMTARSDDALDEALQEEIAEWLSGQGIAHLHLSEEQWRALILATGVAGELGCRAGELMPEKGTPPMLQLRLLLPHDWQDDVRHAATMWLKHAVSQYGWPVDRIAVPEVPDGALTPTAILAQLMPVPAQPVLFMAIVIACASLIGQESVDRMAANDLLFTSSSQARGQIPGEGAAGLLLTDLVQAEQVGFSNIALLGPFSERRRASSADETRRNDATVLLELTEQIATAGGVALSQIEMILADTAHRSNRVLELMGLAAPAIPQVDAADDVVRVGLGSGSCSAVPFMTVLALAQHHARERRAPILCVSNEDPHLRAVALVRPMKRDA
ncbi:hypothetical protein [uncultured Massilia sp.]|uniref:hypothetical protein n=1 Tax=uncultured Massilia sp. TaxID=169973 RepID=UPI00258AC6DD|nr:hypothetical protein [uncultured Massilia sp.]